MTRLNLLSFTLYGLAVAMMVDFLLVGLTASWQFGFLIPLVISLTFAVLSGRKRKPVPLENPLIGVRGFHMGADGVLDSITRRGSWTPGKNTAVCTEYAYASHETPGHRCHCGFNAYHSLKDLRNSDYPYAVAAIVRGWGRGRLHPDGWRSEHAEILALIDDSAVSEFMANFPASIMSYSNGRLIKFSAHVYEPVGNRILLDAASMRYDVPVLTVQQAEHALIEYGTPVDKALIPKAYEL